MLSRASALRNRLAPESGEPLAADLDMPAGDAELVEVVERLNADEADGHSGQEAKRVPALQARRIVVGRFANDDVLAGLEKMQWLQIARVQSAGGRGDRMAVRVLERLAQMRGDRGFESWRDRVLEPF